MIPKLEKRHLIGLFKGLLPGKKCKITDIVPPDTGLGYTSAAKGNLCDIHIAEDHPVMAGLDNSEKRFLRLGVFAHETLHQIFSDFRGLPKYLKEVEEFYKKDNIANSAVSAAAEINNLLEDAYIERQAPRRMGGKLLKALRFSIAHIYKRTPDVDPTIMSPFDQLTCALCMFGDMGVIKGQMDPTVKRIFNLVAPYFYEGTQEDNPKKRYQLSKRITDIARPLWEKEDDTENQSSASSAKSSAAEKASSGANGSSSTDSPISDEEILEALKKRARMEESEAEESSKDEDGSENGSEDDPEDSSEGGSKGDSEDDSEGDSESSGGGKGGDFDLSFDDDEEDEDSEFSLSMDGDDPEDSTTSDDASSEESSEPSESSETENESESESESEPENESESETESDEDIEDILSRMDQTEDVELDDSDKEYFDEADEKAEKELAKEGEQMSVGPMDDKPSSYGDYSCENVNVIPDEEDVEEVNTIVRHYERSISSFVKRIERLIADSLGNREYGKKGKVNTKRLYGTRVTPNVFTKKCDPVNVTDTAICIAVDMSGSMDIREDGIRRIDIAKAIAVSITESFSRLKIPVYVMGFSADQYAQADHYHFVKWKATKAERASLGRIEDHWNNFDPYSIQAASDILGRRKETHKILLVLSDGMPASRTCGSGEIPNKEVGRVVRQARKSGQEVIGVAIGCSDTNVLKTFYGNQFFHANKPESAFVGITKELTRIAKKW